MEKVAREVKKAEAIRWMNILGVNKDIIKLFEDHDIIMAYPYGHPSQSYFDTIRDGYISAGFDPKLLHQAVAENMKGERLYG